MKKNYFLLMTAFLLLCIDSAFAVDQMSVIVEGNIDASFQKRSFVENAVFYTNRTYTISDLPSDFIGFDFLSSDGNIIDKGVIIPSQNGYIYIIAENRTAGISGWEKLVETEFICNTTNLYIYQKQVTAGERVSIPEIDGFPGASPLAKTINYTQNQEVSPDLMSITVEGTTFQKKTFTNGTVFLTNRTTVLENIPNAFDGFEFLSSDGNVIDKGTIIPSQSGLIYIIAENRVGGISGWTLINGIEFNYSDANKTKLYIYQREVSASERIPIPELDGFPGASVLAKTISYNNLTTILDVDSEDFLSNHIVVQDHKLFLTTTEDVPFDIFIYGVTGNIVFVGKEIDIKNGIDLLALSKGIYFVTIQHDKMNYTRKILVQ